MGQLWKDIGERTIWTFVQAAIGVLVASSLLDWNADVVRLAVAAGVAAVLAVVKGYAASKVGDPESASFNPDV